MFAQKSHCVSPARSVLRVQALHFGFQLKHQANAGEVSATNLQERFDLAQGADGFVVKIPAFRDRIGDGRDQVRASANHDHSPRELKKPRRSLKAIQYIPVEVHRVAVPCIHK